MVFTTLTEAIEAVSNQEHKQCDGFRVEVSPEVALEVLNSVENKYWTGILTTADEAYEHLGRGRTSYGVPNTWNDYPERDGYILVCDKEVYPPVFRVGKC